MSRYKVVLEIEDLDGYSEEMIDKAIRDGLKPLAITVINSEPFERIEQKEEKLFHELQLYVENIKEDNLELTFDEGIYYLLHICKNNMPVPLYQSQNINELSYYIYKNYSYEE